MEFEEIDLDKISNADLLRYNYIRLPCRCIIDRYTDVIVHRVCNLHKFLITARKNKEVKQDNTQQTMSKCSIDGWLLHNTLENDEKIKGEKET